MFRFTAEPGQPESENHKVIPSVRAIAAIGMDALKQMVKHFLSRDDIKWTPFNDTNTGNVYYSETHCGIGLSPSIITGHGITRKVLWIMTNQDVDEFNGVTSDGNHRVETNRTN